MNKNIIKKRRIIIVIFIISMLIVAIVSVIRVKKHKSWQNYKMSITSIKKIALQANAYAEISKYLYKEFMKQKLGDLEVINSDILVDLRYGSTNNFTGKKVYKDNIALLRKQTAQKLYNAQKLLNKKGYKIKIWDAYRPIFVQKALWELVKNENYISNPVTGKTVHSKGGAVDITLVGKDGKEVEMPSGFDDFTEKAWRNNKNTSKVAEENLKILTDIMVKSEFKTIPTEWWHFKDSNSAKFEIIEMDEKNMNDIALLNFRKSHIVSCFMFLLIIASSG